MFQSLRVMAHLGEESQWRGATRERPHNAASSITGNCIKPAMRWPG